MKRRALAGAALGIAAAGLLVFAGACAVEGLHSRQEVEVMERDSQQLRA